MAEPFETVRIEALETDEAGNMIQYNVSLYAGFDPEGVLTDLIETREITISSTEKTVVEIVRDENGNVMDNKYIEIHSEDVYGNVTELVIVTYDADGTVLNVRHIQNEATPDGGWITITTIFTYADYDPISGPCGEFLEHQVITILPEAANNHVYGQGHKLYGYKPRSMAQRIEDEMEARPGSNGVVFTYDENGDLIERRDWEESLPNPGKEAPEYVPDDVLVKFTSDVTEEEIGGVIDSLGFSVKEYNDRSGIYVLSFDPAECSVEEAISQLTDTGSVEFAEPNYIMNIDIVDSTVKVLSPPVEKELDPEVLQRMDILQQAQTQASDPLFSDQMAGPEAEMFANNK